MEHPIQELMKTAMQNIVRMVDVSTVVGDAVETDDGTVIIPVSRVSTGFAAAGGDYGLPAGTAVNNGVAAHPFGGGSGAGVSVHPIGFLVVGRHQVRFLSVDDRAVIERVLEAVPGLVDQLERLVGTNGSDGVHAGDLARAETPPPPP